MKRTALAIALMAAGFASLPAVSMAADDATGFFINGEIGRSEIKSANDTDTGYGFNVGYRWGWLGVEAGYTELGTGRDTVLIDTTTSTLRSKLYGYNLGLNGHFNLNDNWYLSARGGAFHFTGKADQIGTDAAGNTVLFNQRGSGFKPYAGVGIGYDFTHNFGIGLNYDYFRASKHDFSLNADMLAFTAEYRFY